MRIHTHLTAFIVLLSVCLCTESIAQPKSKQLPPVTEEESRKMLKQFEQTYGSRSEENEKSMEELAKQTGEKQVLSKLLDESPSHGEKDTNKLDDRYPLEYLRIKYGLDSVYEDYGIWGVLKCYYLEIFMWMTLVFSLVRYIYTRQVQYLLVFVVALVGIVHAGSQALVIRTLSRLPIHSIDASDIAEGIEKGIRSL